MSSEKFINPTLDTSKLKKENSYIGEDMNQGEKFFEPIPEDNQEISSINAGIAGIASGIIKIPQGVVSLGAELLDLGADTNTAVSVEQFFNKINPFEEIANQKAAGKITEALVSVGVPAAAGAKVATKLAEKALKARRAGAYANIGSSNVLKGAKKAQELNTLSKAQRFGAIVAGGAAGETLVADVEKLGTLGDIFESGPTELDRDVDTDNRTDAARKLLNRIKFGSESLLTTPIVYGAFSAGKSLAKQGKELAYSNSQIEKTIDKIGSFFRPRGAQPEEVFLTTVSERGAKMADTNFAMEQVKRIDSEIDGMFPEVKSFFNKTTENGREVFLKNLDEALFAGDIRKAVPENISNNIIDQMSKRGAKQKSIDNVLTSINNVRGKFDELLNITAGGPAAVADIPASLRTDLRKLMGDKVKSYLGNTFKIFENTDFGFYSRYKPTQQSVDKVKDIFKRYAAKNNNPITDLEAEDLVNNVLQQARRINPKSKLPTFRYENLTMGATDPQNIKTFARTLEKNLPGDGEEIKIIGKGSKAFRELFGEVEDVRYSIYEGINKLSNVARKNQLFDEILSIDDAMKASATKETLPGQRGFFFSSPLDARRNLPNNEIVKIDPYVKEYFRDGVLVNRLQGMYTTKDIAEAFSSASRASDFMRTESTSALGKTASWAWRNLILTPKAGSQYAKTVLSIPTHFRNFLSSSAFSLANGTIFESPEIIKQAMKRGKDTIQLGIRSPQAMDRYRRYLELGVTNSNTKIGDLTNLMKDARIGESGNVATDSILRPMINSLGKIGTAVKKGVKKTGQVMQDAYVAEDDFWKITNFEIELARREKAYAKAGIKKTIDELEKEAADIVKNTIPNYAYVGEFVRAMRVTPFGNFMSWPSEIFRTGTNIVRRALDEIKDPITGKINPITSTNPLKSIGMKRLIGGATAFSALPYAIVEGTRSIFGVSDKEAEAAKEFVAPWSKNSQIILVKDPDTGEISYSDWSKNNVYDTLTRPFTTVLNNIQKGIESEDVLVKGLYKGIGQAMAETANPFISESIFTEALGDIVMRGGVTRDGKTLYTEQTPDGEKMTRILKHIGETQLPQYQQVGNVINSVTGKPDKNGDVLEIPDSAAGLFGFKLMKLKPEKTLGFMIQDHQEGQRNARKEFTGGPEGTLKPMKTPEDIIERYFVANKALFDVDKKFLKQIKGAQTLGVNQNKIVEIFDKRGLGKDEYAKLNQGVFDPFFPSDKLQQRFRDISIETGQPNPFDQARSSLEAMRAAFRRQSLNQDLNIKLEDFMPQQSKEVEPQSSLPPQPMPNASVVSPPVQQVANLQNGLTVSENAYLSQSEKQMRLKQRGLA
jgi:hypothetical protein